MTMSLILNASKIWFTVKSLVTSKKMNGNLVPNQPSTTYSHDTLGYSRRNPVSEVTSDDVIRIVNSDTTHIVRVNEYDSDDHKSESSTYKSRYGSACHTNEQGNLKVPEPTVAVICEDIDSNVDYIVRRIFQGLKPKVVGMSKGHLLNYYFSNLGEELLSAKRYEHVIKNKDRNPSEYKAIIRMADEGSKVLPFVDKGEPMYRNSIIPTSSGNRRRSIYYSDQNLLWSPPLPNSDRTVVLLINPPALIAGHYDLYSKMWVNDGLDSPIETNSLLADLFLGCDMSHSIKEDGCLACPNSAIHCSSKLLTQNSLPDTLGPDLVWLNVKSQNRSGELSEADIVKSYHRASMLSAKVAANVLSEDSNLLYVKDYLTSVLGYKKVVGDSVSMSQVTMNKEIVNDNVASYNEMRLANSSSRDFIKNNCEKCDILSICKSNPASTHSYYRKNICSERASLPNDMSVSPTVIAKVNEVKKSDLLLKAIMYLSNAVFNTRNVYYNTVKRAGYGQRFGSINQITHKDLILKDSIVITKDSLEEAKTLVGDFAQIFPLEVFIKMSDENKFPGWLARVHVSRGRYGALTKPIYVCLDAAINMCAPTKLECIPKVLLLDKFSEEFYSCNKSSWYSASEMLSMFRTPKFDRSSLTKYLSMSDCIYSMNHTVVGGYGSSHYYTKMNSSSLSLRPGTGGVRYSRNEYKDPVPSKLSIPSGILDVPTGFMYYHTDRQKAKEANYRLPGILPASRYTSNKWRWYYDTSNSFLRGMSESGILVTSGKVFNKLKFYKLTQSGKTRMVYKRAKFTKVDIGDIRAGDSISYLDIKVAVDNLIRHKGSLWLAEYIVSNTNSYDKDSIYGFSTDGSNHYSYSDIARLTSLVSIYKKVVIRGEYLEESVISSILKKSLVRTNFYGDYEKPTAEEISSGIVIDDSRTKVDSKLLTLIDSATRVVLDKLIIDGLAEVGITYTRGSDDPDYIAASSVSGVVVVPSSELKKYASQLKESSESENSLLLASLASLVSNKASGTDRKRAGKSTRLFAYIPEDGLCTYVNSLGDRQAVGSVVNEYAYSKQYAYSLRSIMVAASFCNDKHSFSTGGLEIRDSGGNGQRIAFVNTYSTIAKIKSITSSLASDTVKEYVGAVSNILEIIKRK
jgi:hypothetical protein